MKVYLLDDNDNWVFQVIYFELGMVRIPKRCCLKSRRMLNDQEFHS